MNPNQEISLKLPLPVVDWLLGIIDEQPRRIANPVYQLIHGQTHAQVNPPEPQVKPEPQTTAPVDRAGSTTSE